MIDVILLLMAVSLFFISGGCVLFFLNRLKPTTYLSNFGWPFIIFLMYSLGVGIVSLQIFLYSLFHIPRSRVVIFLPWVVIAVIIFLLRFRRERLAVRKRYLRPLRGREPQASGVCGGEGVAASAGAACPLVYAMSW